MVTTFLGMTEPTVGADANTWGTKLNAALDLIDAFAGALMGAPEVTVASAATCNIGAATSTVVAISGTVSITSFGSSPNRIRFVRWTGATCNLAYNATSLILLGGAGRTCRVGDTGIYKSDASGNWREVSFFRAGGKQNRSYTSGFVDPAGTTSASYVMMGLGLGLVPAMTGSFRFMITGTVVNSGPNWDTSITARYGTGSAPANGVAVTGSAPTTKDKIISSPGAGYTCDFTFYGEFAASAGVANWLDLAIKTNGGSATIKNLVGYIEELPD